MTSYLRGRAVCISALVLAASLAGCTDSAEPETAPTPADTVTSSTVPSEPSQPASTSPTDSPPTSAEPTSDPAARPTGWGPTRGEWQRARHIVAAMSDRELAGQVIMARYTGTQAPTGLVDGYHLGGVIVMEENVGSIEAVSRSNRALMRSADRPWPLAIGVDQEGGIVARLGRPMTEFPTYMSLGAADDADLATRVAQASGEELRAAGFTMVFAPDADVTIGPEDPAIASRSAGSRPREVARIVAASTRGYQQSGIVPVVKHFPGHGSLTDDSHLTLPHLAASVGDLRTRDLVPFAAAVDAGAPAVMVGHISVDRVDPGVPADLSQEVIGLLDSELGFNGLVVTDALEMAAVTQQYGSGDAAVTALRAGADLILMPLDTAAAFQGIVAALGDGTLARARVAEAAAKIGALMLHEKAMSRPPPSSVGSHRALSYEESAAAITLVKGRCKGPYVGAAVNPIGDPAYVAAFTRAATAAGLTVGSGDVIGLTAGSVPSGPVDVAVSLSTPYSLAYAEADTRIALFGWSPGAMRALVAVLTGEAAPRGSLPVEVDGIEPARCGAR